MVWMGGGGKEEQEQEEEEQREGGGRGGGRKLSPSWSTGGRPPSPPPPRRKTWPDLEKVLLDEIRCLKPTDESFFSFPFFFFALFSLLLLLLLLQEKRKRRRRSETAASSSSSSSSEFFQGWQTIESPQRIEKSTAVKSTTIHHTWTPGQSSKGGGGDKIFGFVLGMGCQAKKVEKNSGFPAVLFPRPDWTTARWALP